MLLLIAVGHAQSFKVGEINCNYKVINFTFTVPCTPVQYASQTYTLDIDGDNISDIAVAKNCNYVYNPGCGCMTGGCVNYIGSSNNFQFAQSAGVINHLNAGTILNNSILWNSGGSFGVYANPFYIGFRKILTNDTIYGWLSTNINCPGGVNSYAYKRTSDTATTVTSTITNTLTTLCFGSTLTLTSNPAGGLFSGLGVSGNVFNSATVPTGTTIVYHNASSTPGYCVNSSSLVLTVNSNTLPGINFNNAYYTACLTSTFNISATPPGGTLTGVGISGNIYNPQVAGAGVHYINYIINDGLGCTKSETTSVTVYSTAVINSSTSSCKGASLALFATPSGGTFTGPDVSSNFFTPTTIALYQVAYSYTNANGCNLTSTVVINVDSCLKVGQTNCNTRDISFTFPAPWPGDSVYTHIVDLDGDSNGDCLVEWDYYYPPSPYWQNKFTLSIKPLISGLYFASDGLNCGSAPRTKNEALGTYINKQQNWNSLKGNIYNTYYSNPSQGFSCGANKDFNLVFKKETLGDTLYGWISGTMWLNTSTNTGPQLFTTGFLAKNYNPCVGIESVPLTGINIYPNPVNDILKLEINEESEFVFNLRSSDGKIINQRILSQGLNHVDLRMYAVGVYYAEVVNDYTRVIKKIIIIR